MVCCDFVCLEEFRGGLLLIWVFVEDLSLKVGAFFVVVLDKVSGGCGFMVG